jgi:hypothetical protein
MLSQRQPIRVGAGHERRWMIQLFDQASSAAAEIEHARAWIQKSASQLGIGFSSRSPLRM